MHTPAMITKLLFVSALLITTGLSEVQTATEDLLRQGLFEEEANRDFDKASERYRAVVAAHDKQRALAATATFRLGEIARKKNDKEAAAAAFRTVAERFPEQEDLARMSRENLAALGMALEATPGKPEVDPFAEGPPEDPQDKEIERLKDIALNSPDLLDGDGATDYGWRALHLAAANGYTKVIAYLLENKADLNSRTTREQLTPLQIATVHGRLAAVNALLAAKARINDEVRFGKDTIKHFPLMDKRADKADGTWTALDFAVVYDRREVVRALVKAGADVKRTGPRLNGSNCTALMAAIYLNRDEIARELIRNGSPLGVAAGRDAGTPLDIAVSYNSSLLPELLEAGADVRIPSGTVGFTPLHRAVYMGYIDLVKLLLDHGAEINAPSAEGMSPLHLASTPEMVDLLISKGATIGAKDDKGLTPLEAMIEGTYVSASAAALDALLAKGASVTDVHSSLQKSSTDMLQAVRERLVYPTYPADETVLMSVNSQVDGTIRWVKPVETRPAPGSPPPSVVEALWMISKSRGYLPAIGNVRIVRREGEKGFRTVFEWGADPAKPAREDFPPVQWGDILEVELVGRGDLPDRGVYQNLVPDRSVAMRLDGVEFPRSLTEPRTFWLGNVDLYLPWNPHAPEERLPAMQSYVQSETASLTAIPMVPDFVDPSRIMVTRKGVQNPIRLDLSVKGTPPFRLVEGDVIDMVLKDSFRKDLKEKGRLLILSTDLGYMGEYSNLGLFAGVALFNALKQDMIYFNCSDVRVVRQGDPEKIERFDFTKIIPSDLSGLESGIRERLSEFNKTAGGDWILLSPLPRDVDGITRESSSKLMDRVRMAGEIMTRPVPQPVPGVQSR